MTPVGVFFIYPNEDKCYFVNSAKIELNPKEPDYIKVVWGIGYKMEQHN